jgi:hypothetical protein
MIQEERDAILENLVHAKASLKMRPASSVVHERQVQSEK